MKGPVLWWRSPFRLRRRWDCLGRWCGSCCTCGSCTCRNRLGARHSDPGCGFNMSRPWILLRMQSREQTHRSQQKRFKVPKDHNRSAFQTQSPQCDFWCSTETLNEMWHPSHKLQLQGPHLDRQYHQTNVIKTADLVEGFEMPKRSPSASGVLQCYGFDLLRQRTVPVVFWCCVFVPYILFWSFSIHWKKNWGKKTNWIRIGPLSKYMWFVFIFTHHFLCLVPNVPPWSRGVTRGSRTTPPCRTCYHMYCGQGHVSSSFLHWL